jgi:hypothetical protein
MGERFERLEETLQICLQMWSDDEGPYEGRHFRLAETICRRYADACNLFSAGHCETEGRDPAEIERTIIAMSNPLDDVDAFLTDTEGYARVGIEKVTLVAGSDDPAGLVRGTGEQVLPRMRDL